MTSRPAVTVDSANKLLGGQIINFSADFNRVSTVGGSGHSQNNGGFCVSDAIVTKDIPLEI